MRLGPRATMAAAFAVSIACHALALGVRFVTVDPPKSAEGQKPLEVILVNAKTASRPTQAEALAQVQLDGGGEHSAGQATSPLAASDVAIDGTSVEAAQKRLSRLEAEQKELLDALEELQTKRRESRLRPTEEAGKRRADETSSDEDRDMLTRRAARVAKEISDWQKRPKRHVFAPSTSEYRFARYVEKWCRAVEAVGNTHFPTLGGKRLYGALRVRVVVDADGTVKSCEVVRASGIEALDRAALAIVKMAAPFDPFSKDIAVDTSSIEITRTWKFTGKGIEARFGP